MRWYQRVTAFNVSFGQDGIGRGWAAGEDRGRGAGEEGGRVVGVVVVEGGRVGLEHGFKADIPLPNHD